MTSTRSQRLSAWFDSVRRAVFWSVACLLILPVQAGAQTNWWDQFQGFGSPNNSAKSTEDGDKPKRIAEPLNDLRPGATPWRSDAMLDAIGGAIERYQRIADKGGWPLVPVGRLMRPGEDDPRVPILRKRLRASGDLTAKSQYQDSETFDSDLEEAVKNFQMRNGLRPTGRIERSVYPVLNITAAERVDELKLNYDRLRALMNGGIEDRYVFVNVPAFQLEAVERHEVQQRHRVIAGRPERQTPEVRATIKALNFFPFWRVPDSVAVLDLIPKLQKEPEYLENEGIRVFNGVNGAEIERRTIDWFSPTVASYKFKQDPGDKNALGLVRLDMSNEFGVYMHDTPLKPLFDQRSRPFSAGCVRVQDVFDLAEWVAKYEQGWEQPGNVKHVLDGGQPLDLNLTRPVPVYFAYITAWAEPETGTIQFRPDIYGKNRTNVPQASAAGDPGEAPPAAAAVNALAP